MLNKFNHDELTEFARSEREKERNQIMSTIEELAKHHDSLIINNFVLEIKEWLND